MGRLEKIVVVAVLFLVAVILGISLSADSDEGGNIPLSRDRRGARRLQEETLAKGAVENPPAPVADGANQPALQAQPAGALNVGVQPKTSPANEAQGAPGATGANQAAANVPQSKPESAPLTAPPANVTPAPAANAFILSKEGLEPTTSEDFMVYTWKAGDTLKALAQKFYGSPLHVARLRAANEGIDEAQLGAGSKILVAVQPSSSAGQGAAAIKNNQADASKSNGAVVDGTYTVKSGDVLGTISKNVYGTSKHWKKIYDANKDVIGEDANKLKVGMKLRIPQI